MKNVLDMSGWFLVLLLGSVWCQNDGSNQNKLDENNASTNETSFKHYNAGVKNGIINPERYSFQSFLRDEGNVFNNLYQEYTSNDTQPINYEEWLIMNNFGILPDTQESLFEKKISKRSTADNKRRFVNTVRRGDILITGRGVGGLIGHAAIMSSDYYVLEMRGGNGWQHGIRDNNRQISKHRWFDEHKHDWTTVYRSPDANVARMAAVWADHTYYNPHGGSAKLKHITYLITPQVWSTNPSYCSKLVVQAFYYGTGKRRVIGTNNMRVGRVIVPTQIPKYFQRRYQLQNKGRF